MVKKIWIPIVAVLIVALAAGGVWATSAALAQEESPTNQQGLFGRLRALAANGKSPLAKFMRARPVMGQVTEIDLDQFTIMLRGGQEQTFLVDENTRFRSRQQEELNFDDLEVGRWVSVVAPKNQDEATARGVILLPEDFDPEAMGGTRGEITDVNLSQQTFTVQPQLGPAVTIKVTGETVFRGGVEGLDDLEEGMRAMVLTQEAADGSLEARTVSANYPAQRKLGEVTAVDEDASRFTLKTRQGDEEVTITVDEQTRFRSKDGSLQSLADLQTGMTALVMLRELPGDELLAVTVAAGERQGQPRFEKRAGGKVLAVDKDSFTIQARDGQEYTFKVTGQTTFRSRGVQVQSIDDLQAGMRVLVGAKELGNGDFQAQTVVVFPALTE
ncbi:MAG: DUF5666 domain-containing protein [Chloroflexota bacterium]